MAIEEILDEMEAILQDSGRVPFTHKRLIDQDELGRLIDEIHETLPGEIMEANRIINERQRIFDEAKKEAQNIIDQAKDYISKLTDENTITRQAQEQANEIIQQARKNSRDLQSDSVAYADEVFSYIEENLMQALEVVRQGHSKLHPNKSEQAEQE
ncbi:MAG: hypothetical protein H6Q73_2540 [Firmicutes bacterium]|nr:hypothetical protein [Bacillota bacterium]